MNTLNKSSTVRNNSHTLMEMVSTRLLHTPSKESSTSKLTVMAEWKSSLFPSSIIQKPWNPSRANTSTTMSPSRRLKTFLQTLPRLFAEPSSVTNTVSPSARWMKRQISIQRPLSSTNPQSYPPLSLCSVLAVILRNTRPVQTLSDALLCSRSTSLTETSFPTFSIRFTKSTSDCTSLPPKILSEMLVRIPSRIHSRCTSHPPFTITTSMMISPTNFSKKLRRFLPLVTKRFLLPLISPRISTILTLLPLFRKPL